MARRAVKQELSRERIVQVARELFARLGYSEVSMRSIGKELGYSHGAIYYHFKEKAELFYAMIKDDFILLNRLLAEVLDTSDADAPSKMEQAMLAFIRFGLDYPHHYELMFLINDPELKGYSQPEQIQCFEQFSAVVHEADKEQGFVLNPRENVPWFLFLSVHGFITHYIHARRKFSQVEQRAQEHVRFLSSCLK